MEGADDVFPVGHHGQTYLNRLAASNRLRVDWRGQACTFDLALPAGDDPLPDLGRFTCAGVHR